MNKSITVTDDVYEDLVKLKGNGESFTDVIRMLLEIETRAPKPKKTYLRNKRKEIRDDRAYPSK